MVLLNLFAIMAVTVETKAESEGVCQKLITISRALQSNKYFMRIFCLKLAIKSPLMINMSNDGFESGSYSNMSK